MKLSIAATRTTVLAGILSLAACTPPTPAAQPLPATPVNASFGKTWGAVVDVLAERNIPVKTMDRSSGFVTAELAGLSRDDLNQYTVGCTGFMDEMVGGIHGGVARYNILVHGDSSSSTVKVTARFTKATGDGKDCPSNGSFEQPFQNDVKARAEAK